MAGQKERCHISNGLKINAIQISECYFWISHLRKEETRNKYLSFKIHYYFLLLLELIFTPPLYSYLIRYKVLLLLALEFLLKPCDFCLFVCFSSSVIINLV